VLLWVSRGAMECHSVAGSQGQKERLRLVWEKETKDLGGRALIYRKMV